MAEDDIKRIQAVVGRDLDPDEVERALILSEDARAMIQVRIPDVEERAKVSAPYGRTYAMIVAKAAARVLQAPNGGLYKYETEGTYTYSINSDVASGVLEILPSEWALLIGGAAGTWASGQPDYDAYVRGRDYNLRDGVYDISYRPTPGPLPPDSVFMGLHNWREW